MGQFARPLQLKKRRGRIGNIRERFKSISIRDETRALRALRLFTLLDMQYYLPGNTQGDLQDINQDMVDIGSFFIQLACVKGMSVIGLYIHCYKCYVFVKDLMKIFLHASLKRVFFNTVIFSAKD